MNKRIIFVLGIIGLPITLYSSSQVGTKKESCFNGSSKAAISIDEKITEPANGDYNGRIAPVMSNKNNNSTNLSARKTSDYDYANTLAKASELQEELIKLGYFIPPEHVASYESYTEDALLQMVDYGDMVAIAALKHRYLKAEQWETLRAMQEEAVLHGAISDISDLHDIEFSKYTGEDSRDRLIKAAAYAELGGLRGSNVSVYYAITNFNENNIEFSLSELAQISQMAKDMLNQINVKRRDRGKEALAKIDDSQLINIKPDTSLSGWGRKFVATRQD